MEKRFRNEYGKSIGEYLITLRMGQAQLLLVSTDTPVKEIAEEVGYYNVSQFNTLFKKRFELTPSDYRKKYKNSLNEGVK